jgi:hypothetical protein
MKRTSKDDRWVQTDFDDIKDAKYDSPYPAANAIVIGIIKT